MLLTLQIKMTEVDVEDSGAVVDVAMVLHEAVAVLGVDEMEMVRFKQRMFFSRYRPSLHLLF